MRTYINTERGLVRTAFDVLVLSIIVLGFLMIIGAFVFDVVDNLTPEGGIFWLLLVLFYQRTKHLDRMERTLDHLVRQIEQQNK